MIKRIYEIRLSRLPHMSKAEESHASITVYSVLDKIIYYLKLKFKAERQFSLPVTQLQVLIADEGKCKYF